MGRVMVSLLFIATALAGLGQMGAPAHPAEPAPWGEFARSEARRSPITITVGTVPGEVGGQPVYWAKRVGWTEGGATDSVKCPALAAVVESIRHIRLPKAAPGHPEILIGDGTMYSLTVPASYDPPHASNLDKLTVTAAGGPLADWVNGALQKLEGCWSRTNLMPPRS
jgi:hypothetical protein